MQNLPEGGGGHQDLRPQGSKGAGRQGQTQDNSGLGSLTCSLRFLVKKLLLNQFLPCLSRNQHVVEDEGLRDTLAMQCAQAVVLTKALHIALKTPCEQK